MRPHTRRARGAPREIESSIKIDAHRCTDQNLRMEQSDLEAPAQSFCTQRERQSRIELAGAYRLASHYGWEPLIYNHIALRVPGEPCFLVKPHALRFSEITASSLLKLRLDGKPMTFGENVNTAAFVIHTAILNERPDVNCTLHVHTVPGMAMSAHARGLLPLTQSAMRFYERISYHPFEGFATEVEERQALARDLGPRNKAMILRNHGLLTCGATAYEAVATMRALVQCCETQLMLEASGAEMVLPEPAVCARSAAQFEQILLQTAGHERAAYLRLLDEIAPGYAN
ncbi:MAG TPA: class II aldolase/adducin family protein [Ramlibacter sp.]|nr:class II aldolase/adducin family protein [Ramlibacter sp.]